jgi:hypothetical protein
MKKSFFSASLALLLTCGYSKESSNLRGNKESPSMKPTEASVESHIVLQGVFGDPSADDLNRLGSALLSSYNGIHWDLGRVMHEAQVSSDWNLDYAESSSSSSSKHSRLSVSIMASIRSSIPEATMTMPLQYSCDGCLCDDDNVQITLNQGGVKQSAHTVLEESFCNKIQSITSGRLSYFLDINECSIVLLDGPKEKANNQIHDILVDKK